LVSTITCPGFAPKRALYFSTSFWPSSGVSAFDLRSYW
jgi:hypothetical protein